MQYDDIVRTLLQEGKSLSKNERSKAEGEYDPIYIEEKIKFHARRVQRTRLVVFLLYLTLIVAVFSLIFYEDIPAGAQLWMKALMALLGVLCLIGLPALMTNHGRNASVLKMVRAIQLKAKEEQAQGVGGIEPEVISVGEDEA